MIILVVDPHKTFHTAAAVDTPTTTTVDTYNLLVRGRLPPAAGLGPSVAAAILGHRERRRARTSPGAVAVQPR